MIFQFYVSRNFLSRPRELSEMHIAKMDGFNRRRNGWRTDH